MQAAMAWTLWDQRCVVLVDVLLTKHGVLLTMKC